VAAKFSRFSPFKRSNSICSTNYAVLSLSVVKQPLVRRVITRTGVASEPRPLQRTSVVCSEEDANRVVKTLDTILTRNT